MGELITKNGSIGQWLDRIDATRNTLIASAKSGNRVAAAFAMADARAELIESLKDHAIRAKLLRMTDPEIAMVELANNPNDEDRIRICAIGILSGFTPGDEQFSIFGGGFDKRANKPKPGKLYIKERGFRTLFSHLGIVPEVRNGHPTWGSYGGGEKKLWSVTGTAECSYAGENYAVEFAGESSVRIEGYDSDNTAGIAAKCRRRLLQALWVKVSPILTQDQAYDSDDEPDTVPVTEQTAQIEVTETPIKKEDTDTRHTGNEQPKETKPFKQHRSISEFDTLRQVTASEFQEYDDSKAGAFNGLWEAFTNVKNVTALKAAAKDATGAKDLFGDAAAELLGEWYLFRLAQLKGELK